MATHPKRFSIRRYLTSNILLWVLVMTSLPALWAYLDTQHEVEELFDASLAQSARVLHGLINRNSVNDNLHHLTTSLQNKDLGLEHFSDEEFNERGHSYEKKVAFQVWSPQGKLIIKSASAPDKQLAPLQKGYYDSELDDHNWRTFALYSESDQWWLILGERSDIRTEITTNIVHNHIWPILLTIPLLALVTWLLIGRSLAPLQKITGQLNDRSYQDLGPLDTRQAPDETMALTTSMNDLFQRLDKAYQRESRFAGNAAHELRNPLASLMIHTENALEDNQLFQQADTTKQRDDLPQYLAQQHSDLSQVRQGISRLSHIVRQLLALSRAETTLQQQAELTFDLSELCQEVIVQHQIPADQKQQTISINSVAAGTCNLYANKPLITSLLNNLLSNAINYTPEQGHITIHCDTAPVTGNKPEQGNAIMLRVDDSGPGIPEAEREQVKNRFYRIPGNDQHGAGLGLSIVNTIAERHGYQWHLSKSGLGGLAVTVIFPATPE